MTSVQFLVSASVTVVVIVVAFVLLVIVVGSNVVTSAVDEVGIEKDIVEG